MRKLIAVIISLCFAVAAHAQEFPVENLKVTGSVYRRINIAIVPDGFTSAEMSKFTSNANTLRTTMFGEAPLMNYSNFFNVYCIDVPSPESGCDHPGTAKDVTEPKIPVKDVNTYFNATFDGNFTHRALVCKDQSVVFSVLAVNLPSYDQVLLIANSTEYGGTGGAVGTSSLNPSANEIVRHELGHTFAKLADEYWAGTVFAGEKANMTAETTPYLAKWHDWLSIDMVGLYPYGTGVDEAKWFRPHQNCKMQFLNAPFCHVCQQAFIDKIYQTVTPIDSTYPESGATAYTATGPMQFYMSLIRPIPNTLTVKWQLHGVDVTVSDTMLVVNEADMIGVDDTLVAFITDTTPLSRTYRPATGYQFSATWYLHKGAVGVDVRKGPDNTKFFYSIYPVPAKNSAWLEYDNMTADTKADYVITDMNGKVITRKTIALQHGKQKEEISTADLAPGTYLLSIRSAAINIAEKIVVE